VFNNYKTKRKRDHIQFSPSEAGVDVMKVDASVVFPSFSVDDAAPPPLVLLSAPLAGNYGYCARDSDKNA